MAFLLVNPRSGSADRLDELLTAASRLGVATHVLADDEDPATVAAEADANALGIAGGDGSLAAVAAVALERNLPFVCIPFGTRNHFARDAGLPDDPVTALAAYWALGLPLAGVGEGAAGIRLSRLRGEELPLPRGGVLINDCWNANPASMAAALRELAARRNGGRRIAVLGGMAELGQEGPAYHREIGALAAGLDVVVGVGELARDYDAAYWVSDAQGAAALLDELLEPGDVVLVKGSRSVGLEHIAQNLT